MIDVKKLEEAVRIIRDVCKECNSCSSCPLHVRNNTCGISWGTPEEWKLFNEPADDEVPVIFKMR